MGPWEAVTNIVTDLIRLVGWFLESSWHWGVLIAWVAWWLGAVNWRRLWPVLAEGAWVPLTLLCVLGALVWSQLAPGNCDCLGFVSVANFWWQLGGVGLILALTLCCGWLQGVFGWTPAEIAVEPPAHAEHGHDHGHDHH